MMYGMGMYMNPYYTGFYGGFGNMGKSVFGAACSAAFISPYCWTIKQCKSVSSHGRCLFSLLRPYEPVRLPNLQRNGNTWCGWTATAAAAATAVSRWNWRCIRRGQPQILCPSLCLVQFACFRFRHCQMFLHVFFCLVLTVFQFMHLHCAACRSVCMVLMDQCCTFA